jgi:hypothetical protein
MQPDRGASTLVLVLIVAAALVLGLSGFLYYRHSVTPAKASVNFHPPMTAEEKAYLSSIEISDPRMSAADNFLGDTVTYLDAKVMNKGMRGVQRLDLRLEFLDTLNQVVLREVAHPVTRRTAPLKAGEAREFRVSFEHMPADWNQAPPRVTPIHAQFSE